MTLYEKIVISGWVVTVFLFLASALFYVLTENDKMCDISMKVVSALLSVEVLALVPILISKVWRG